MAGCLARSGKPRGAAEYRPSCGARAAASAGVLGCSLASAGGAAARSARIRLLATDASFGGAVVWPQVPGEVRVTDLGHGKTRWGSALFRFDARRRLERAFSCCLVSGLARLRSHLERGPAILGLNHVSFWDGFLLPQLEHAASADGYCLMDRANLERLSF